MSKFFANPYDITKTGFYVEDFAEFSAKRSAAEEKGEEFPEEFAFECIESEYAQLFEALGTVHEDEFEMWFDLEIEEMGEEEAARIFVCVELGYSLNDATSGRNPKCDDVILYEGDEEAAAEEELESSGALDAMPESLRPYFDFEKYARDCRIGGDYHEFEFEGTTYTCVNHSGF